MNELDYNLDWEYSWVGDVWDNIDDDVKEIIKDKDTIAVGVPKDKIIKYPFSSNEKYLTDKKINYKLLGLLMLLSNYNPKENYRYVKYRDLVINEHMLETLSGNKMDTIKRNIKKLANIDGDLVIAKTTENGVIYEINYLNEDGRKYVLIEDKILKKLMTFTSNFAIKIYILLKYRCGEEGRIITRDDICRNVGLSPKSHNNLDVITDILTGLEQVGLINIENIYDKIIDENTGKECIRKLLKISIVTYEEWIKFEDKSKNKIKGSYNFIDYEFN